MVVDRRGERTMASKETTAAGFVNVSREITGELGETRGDARATCAEAGGVGGGTRRAWLVSLLRPAAIKVSVRLVWRSWSPRASTGNVSPGRIRVNSCWELVKIVIASIPDRQRFTFRLIFCSLFFRIKICREMHRAAGVLSRCQLF